MYKALVVLLLIVLSACGKKLDGTYIDDSGLLQYSFNSNGMVYQSSMGIEVEMPYTIEGDKIKLPIYQGVSMVLTLLADGSIQSHLGILRKKDATNIKQPASKPKSIRPQTNDAEAILKKLIIEEDNCRGGSGDRDATWDACERRDLLVEDLTKLGWCWAPDGSPEYEKSWEPCKK